ncbi:MAG: hypothetical protein WC763_02310 [Candidatus Paceibacterota bacterium]|jgi:hypothetical protein
MNLKLKPVAIPNRRIQVIGGTIKKDTFIFPLCFIDEESRVIPRLFFDNAVTKGAIYFELTPIARENLRCRLDSEEVFRALAENMFTSEGRREGILDLAIVKLTNELRIDLRKWPKVPTALTLRNCEKKSTCMFEDCTIFTEFLPELFDFKK